MAIWVYRELKIRYLTRSFSTAITNAKLLICKSRTVGLKPAQNNIYLI